MGVPDRAGGGGGWLDEAMVVAGGDGSGGSGARQADVTIVSNRPSARSRGMSGGRRTARFCAGPEGPFNLGGRAAGPLRCAATPSRPRCPASPAPRRD